MSDFDLNLTRVFVLLYETGSVTITADTLHVTQPTISYSLRKLRRHFDDVLFQRSGRGLLPTSVAQRMYEPLHRALSEIDGVLQQAEEFDPAVATRFTIALSDLGEVTLLPRLAAAARERAPDVSFTVRPLDVADVERQLGRGELDAVLATPVLASHRTVRIPLFRERHVGLVAVDHPRLRSKAATKHELHEEHYATVIGPSGHTGPRAILARHGLLDRVVVEVSRFSALPYLLEATDLVAILPEYVAEAFTRSHRLRIFRARLDSEPIEVAVYARHEASRTPAQRWLVRLLVDVLGEPVSPAQLPPLPS
jgi:DNA-binding transcriptional LysR family regulator